jgi:hypothetical protein
VSLGLSCLSTANRMLSAVSLLDFMASFLTFTSSAIAELPLMAPRVLQAAVRIMCPTNIEVTLIVGVPKSPLLRFRIPFGAIILQRSGLVLFGRFDELRQDS